MRRFTRWYAIPVAVLVVAVAAWSGIGPAAGVLILFGGIGLLLFAWVWLTGRNRRTNPEVTFDGQVLAWARQRVPVDQISWFTTLQTTSTISIDATTHGTAHFGVARFHLADGQTVEFTWTDLPDEELDTLRQALDAVIPADWRPAEGA